MSNKSQQISKKLKIPGLTALVGIEPKSREEGNYAMVCNNQTQRQNGETWGMDSPPLRMGDSSERDNSPHPALPVIKHKQGYIYFLSMSDAAA